MNGTNTKAMEEALQAAVARMSNAGPVSDTQGGFTDPIGLMMTFFAKMMENNEGRSDVLEKLEGLQKEDLGSLRAQMRVVRRQLQHMMKVQQELLDELREMKQQQADQQSAVASAVLDLCDQMARVGIVDDALDDGADEPLAPTRDDRGAKRNITDTARVRRNIAKGKNDRP